MTPDPVFFAIFLLFAALGTATRAQPRADVLSSVSGLPPHIAGVFEEPLAFQQTPGGPYYVFDRRGHTVYTVDASRVSVRKLTEIGLEQGRIIQPRGFDVHANGSFVVADAPGGVERVQTFGPAGLLLNAFRLPVRQDPVVTLGTMVLNGLGSVQYAGPNLLISAPQTGALFTEYSPSGTVVRSFGTLRGTGHESDRDLHLALNAGLPLPDPTGGYVFVFLSGRPMFRKYDDRGRFQFERHVEGRELDAALASQPTRWTQRRSEDRELPTVEPLVRAAAVDPRGRLWVSLVLPYTYVYDPHGDKLRTVQFKAAGIVSPSSLFFTEDGRLLVTPGCYEFRPPF